MYQQFNQNKTYHTRSYDDLNCKSRDLVYGLECNICGLVYVGETKGELHTRMNKHRYDINGHSNTKIGDVA
jgi:hypothetical protein